MITVVIPTVGRPSLAATLQALQPGVRDGELAAIVVVDDRPSHLPPLPEPPAAGRVRVLRCGGRGPAAARNLGWRAADTPWVVFLDDDVVPRPGWAARLHADLAGLPGDVGGSQGRLEVPLPADRRPTDAERNTAGLAEADWITADMAYRRDVLAATGGFDERFPRAYREDADLALRVRAAGYRLVKGERVTRHPVRDDGFWASVRRQRGNADDALLRRIHGPGWRDRIGARGRLRRHAAVTGAGLLAIACGAAAVRAGRTGSPWAGPLRGAAATAGLGWLSLTAEFAWARVAPGPRTPAEIARMALTSAVIPPAACLHRLRGEWRVRRGPDGR